MPETRTTSLGNIEVRSVEGSPGRFEGMALPYGVTIDVSYGRERFVRGAFADAVRDINAGERVAYLNRHGIDGGVPVGVVNHLQERDTGLWFAGDFLDVPETPQARSQVQSGLNGVSVEFVPGKHRRKADVVEHYSGARLAAIAGSYAPAYRAARVALRSVARATERGKVPNLTVAALTERRDAITTSIATVRSIAESEDRALDETETRDIESLSSRLTNVDALIVEARADEQRRDAERRALPQQRTGSSPAIVTRSESVYGPGQGHSYFADLMVANRDSSAAERQSRHKALVIDLAQQFDRAVDSSDLQGAYPTQYYPDLYVPDIAYSGPLSAFFATTPITAPNPISVPYFDVGKQVGDTDVQTAQNAPVANIDMGTGGSVIVPKTIGGEVIVSRQAVDGASPGTDVIIGTQLRELLMRDTEREIALVLEALSVGPENVIPDTAGVAGAGNDLHNGIAAVLGQYYAGAAAGGDGARMLPAEAVFVNATDWGNLIGAVDASGRSLLSYVNPQNALGQMGSAPGFQSAIIGGVPVTPAWALLADTNEIVARRNDARQWKSTVLDLRLIEREGPQSIVFAIWQYFAFAVLEPKGVRRYTYTNV